MKKYYTLFVILFVVSCSTAPKVEVVNPHANLLSKTEMQALVIKRYFSYIHCRNAEATLLDIRPIVNKGGKEIIPVTALIDFQEIKGMAGWRSTSVKALYHFSKEVKKQWKVKKIRDLDN